MLSFLFNIRGSFSYKKTSSKREGEKRGRESKKAGAKRTEAKRKRTEAKRKGISSKTTEK